MSTKENGTAVHGITGSGNHVVGIGALLVLLLEDEGSWYAQGLEIDYVAQGESIEVAKSNFEIGLHATVRENLRKHLSISPILTPAPREVWDEIPDAGVTASRFYYVSFHDAAGWGGQPRLLPFQGIGYVQAGSHG